MYAGIGLLVGCFFSLTTILKLNPSQPLANMGPKAVVYGVIFYLIISPIICGALGFLGGMMSAGFFNFAARWCGGLKVET